MVYFAPQHLRCPGAVSMSDLRFIAERWIAQHGPRTPQLVRQWAQDLKGAPTAAEFLEQIAAAAETVLREQSAEPSA